MVFLSMPCRSTISTLEAKPNVVDICFLYSGPKGSTRSVGSDLADEAYCAGKVKVYPASAELGFLGKQVIASQSGEAANQSGSVPVNAWCHV